MLAIIVAFGVGLLFSLLLTPSAVRLFKHWGWAQPIRVDGPQTHLVKRGTPTKGGLVFSLGTIVAYFVAHLAVPGIGVTPSGLLVLLSMVGFGAIGYMDDHLKVKYRNSGGLSERGKVLGQIGAAAVIVPLAMFWGPEGHRPLTAAVSFVRDITWLDLSRWGPVVAVIVMFVLVAIFGVVTTNAVNFTDGLDGLLVGCAIATLSAFFFIEMLQARNMCRFSNVPGCFTVAHPTDLAVVTCALTGSLSGYMWWGARPTKIFMGDSGSLALGGVFVALALFTKTVLLFPILGCLYVAMGGSVLLQRYWFKLTKGKRLFKMAPLHHHFELLGWSEETITARFWIIATIGAGIGFGIFYWMWLSASGLLF